jgi:hypothetical protein
LLDVWPSLPLVVEGFVGSVKSSRHDDIIANMIAVVERSDRVRSIDLDFLSRSSKVEKVWAAMQEPFPELVHMKMCCYKTKKVVPDSFLGGSAPRLRFLELFGIPFPEIPKLLLSTTHLDTLDLYDIPHSGYFSPEAIVTGLSRTTSLNKLSIVFRSPQSRPDPESQRPLPPTRTDLPALTYIKFKGTCEYLDDLVARIDTPRLKDFLLNIFNPFDCDTHQLHQFVSRTPTLKAHNETH